MTTAQVAEYLGLSRRDAGRWLSRHGITALGREPGVGQNLYPAELVRDREHLARPAQAWRYDRWRDVDGTPIPVGCRVTQIAVAKEHGALSARRNKHAVVTQLGTVTGRGYRIRVRFDGETESVTIRPHLVRVLPTETDNATLANDPDGLRGFPSLDRYARSPGDCALRNSADGEAPAKGDPP